MSLLLTPRQSFTVNCLDVFMRHANGTAAKWDLIFFNSGLHNLDNSTRAPLLSHVTSTADGLTTLHTHQQSRLCCLVVGLASPSHRQRALPVAGKLP